MLDATIRTMGRATRAIAFGLALGICASSAAARQTPSEVDQESSAVPLAELPRQARQTYQLILQGGPFPYDKDGTTFGNRERLLPQQRRGYYREYTVKTPWVRDRGARRIVCGGKQATQPDSCYYTSDHYNSFRMITP
jgi:ribonuclease T1